MRAGCRSGEEEEERSVRAGVESRRRKRRGV